MQARKYLVSRKEVVFAVTTDVLALVMSLFGAVCGVAITVMHYSLKADLERMSREEHPTSIVSPESLHATFHQVMVDTILTVQALADDAKVNDWYWSNDYYARQARHMESMMLPYDYYVKGDLKKTPYIDRNNY
jgi:hypothetical protein